MKCCVGCGTKKDVFYDRVTDFFICNECKNTKKYFQDKRIIERYFKIKKRNLFYEKVDYISLHLSKTEDIEIAKKIIEIKYRINVDNAEFIEITEEEYLKEIKC